jgi:hypothetical protein
MTTIHVETSQTIDAPPGKVFSVISNYHTGHPAILPKQYFEELTVTKGGQGDGTEITFKMNVLGTERRFAQVVTEPEPGRVIVETERDGSVVTRFTVDPVDGGAKSRVTIASDIKASPGFRGYIERFLVPILNRRIYNQELGLLADYVRN